VYRLAQLAGIPDDSCSSYMAVDTTCDAQFVSATNKPPCYTCWPETSSTGELVFPGDCSPTPQYRKLFASSVHAVSGGKQMRAAIYAGGPISCGIVATDEIDDYAGGTFSQPGDASEYTASHINHVVVVVGWGRDDVGNDYWLLRNSWGVEWGEDGFMRIVRSDNSGPAGVVNNAIESDCFYAVPDRFDYQ